MGVADGAILAPLQGIFTQASRVYANMGDYTGAIANAEVANGVAEVRKNLPRAEIKPEEQVGATLANLGMLAIHLRDIARGVSVLRGGITSGKLGQAITSHQVTEAADATVHLSMELQHATQH
jgi:hypothetical protein